MVLRKRSILFMLLFIGLVAAGFIFLIRGCLSKYDERSALPTILHFENDGTPIIFSIVRFEKANSYSQKGGITTKSVTTTYYIQCNDGKTGKKIADKMIIRSSGIKNYPVEILGASANTAWLFMNELMAFDPYTLQQKAGPQLIEQKNPDLRGRLPAERRFYVFDQPLNKIKITARDGTEWALDSETLLAVPYDENSGTVESEKQKFEKLIALNRQLQDSLYEKKLRNPSRQLAAGRISRNEYDRLGQGFHEERHLLNLQRDSLHNLARKAESTLRSQDAIRRKIGNLQSLTKIPFSQLKVNADTAMGHWFGLYSSKEFEKINDRVADHTANDETARRQLHTCAYLPNRNDDMVIVKNQATVLNRAVFFLDGGFLLDKQTAKPARTGEQSFIVIHKSQVGNEGTIQISVVKVGDGSRNWLFDTGLKEWTNYIYTGERLYIMGSDHAEISGSDCNLLLCLDLKTGKAGVYDFFTDKNRP